MDELITFLRAQLDDDERVAHAACLHIDDCNDSGYADRFDEERALAEIDAKRHILDLHDTLVQRQADNSAEFVRLSSSTVLDQQRFTNVKTHGWELSGRLDSLRSVIVALAQPYADRDGYREEWRPAT